MHNEPDHSALVSSGETVPAARPRLRRWIKAETETAGPRTVLVFPAAVLSGAAVSVAWWYPETSASALLGWVAAFLLVFVVRARRSYLPSYLSGLVCCSLGFYWVHGTVSLFGGFGAVPAALLFALYAVVTAGQFLVFAFLHHNLGPWFDSRALRAPTALVLSEFVSVRLFQWNYGHTQIAFTPFAQVADVGGALLVYFLMFWVAEVAVRTILFREWRKAFLVPLLGFGLALGHGFAAMSRYATPRGETQEVILVQGNFPLSARFEEGAVERNVQRLHDLSATAGRANALIVWPEGAIPAFLPADLGSARAWPVLPWIGDGSAFLVGSYAIDRDQNRYNAAFAVRPDGAVPPPYYKRILIPFGEYMPFSSSLPWLKELNGNAGVFHAGTEAKVFEYPMHRADGTEYALKVAPLICYEDTVPALAREATRGGAELLVNLTYDTWFGRSAAPFEHHLIAAFRAIENRRYLVRATNTGLSAVVDPLGRTVARLPIFEEGTASARVVLMTEQSLYTRFVGETPWWGLLAVSLAAIARRRWSGADRAVP